MITNADITIFNKRYDPVLRADIWDFAHLRGVHYEARDSSSAVRSGLISHDSATIFIPFSVSCDKKYVRPLEYEKSPEAAWTIREGDIIVLGLVEHDLSRMDEIFRTFDFCQTVRNVETRNYGSRNMRHFEVLCGLKSRKGSSVYV